MKIQARYTNGIKFEFEIIESDLPAFLESIKPRELNTVQAAKFCGISEATFRKRKIPKNENGKYNVDELIRRATESKS